MRLIRLKIKPKVKQALTGLASQFRTQEVGFVEDMFALLRLKGNGMPTKKRIDALIDALAAKGGMNKVNASIAVKKRVHVLSEARSTAYFKALTVLPDPIDATRRVLLNFQKLYLKYREVQCLTCSFRPDCDFGKQYGDKTTDITHVLDPDFKKKVNPQCPVLPEIDSTQQVASAIKSFKQMATQQAPEAAIAGTNLHGDIESQVSAEDDNIVEDDFVENLDPTDENNASFENTDTGSGAHTAGFFGAHTGAQYVKHFEKVINDLNRTQLVIFELGLKLKKALSVEKKGKFVPTEEMSKDKTQAKMKHRADESKLVSSQHGLPDELYDQRAEKKELIKQQHQEPIKKRKCLYLLIDESGSMGTLLRGNVYGLLTRAALALTFSMALIRHTRDEGGIVFVRFFAGSPSPLTAARTKEEFNFLLQFVAHTNFNGGGTQILNALRACVNDIQAARDELSESEVLVISDAEDSFSVDACRKVLKGQEVNVLDVSARARTSTGQHRRYAGGNSLKALAKTYHHVDPTSLKIEDIISVV